LKRICDKLKKYGVGIISVISDGYNQSILPIFIDCGINCLSPCAVGCGGVHPGVLLDEYPGELRIMGAVDKLIFHNGKEAIDEYVKSLVPYVKRGGFIPHVDHSVYPQMGQDNYLYYIKRFRQLFG
jgi:uroporphyrinogen decarboxylase